MGAPKQFKDKENIIFNVEKKEKGKWIKAIRRIWEGSLGAFYRVAVREKIERDTKK